MLTKEDVKDLCNFLDVLPLDSFKKTIYDYVGAKKVYNVVYNENGKSRVVESFGIEH